MTFLAIQHYLCHCSHHKWHRCIYQFEMFEIMCNTNFFWSCDSTGPRIGIPLTLSMAPLHALMESDSKEVQHQVSGHKTPFALVSTSHDADFIVNDTLHLLGHNNLECNLIVLVMSHHWFHLISNQTFQDHDTFQK